MSWKLRNAGWNRGMKRYQKKGGGYGYYDPNSDGVEYLILGLFLLIVGILIIPLEIMPLPPILIIGGVVFIVNYIYFLLEENQTRKAIEKKYKKREKELDDELFGVEKESKIYEKLKKKLKGKKLKKLSKPMIKKKLIEWAQTEEMKDYLKDTKEACRTGEPYDLENFLYLRWINWVMMNGYKFEDW